LDFSGLSAAHAVLAAATTIDNVITAASRLPIGPALPGRSQG